MRTPLLLTLLVVAIAIAGKFLLQHSQAGLKARIAVELFGWDGLFRLARESAATRLLGSRATKSRRRFHDMLDALGRNELDYLVPQRRVLTDNDIAEGHRFLTHLLSAAFRLYYEADLDRPHFAQMVSPHDKLLGDNPDALYYQAVIRRDRAYLIKGKSVGEDYISFTVYEGPCVGCFTSKVVADMNDRQIKLESDGSFEIVVGPDAMRGKGERNFLSLGGVTPNAHPVIITRHYYERELSIQMNRSAYANISISVISSTSASASNEEENRGFFSGRITDADSSERLDRVISFVSSHTVEMPQDPAKAPKWFSFTPNVFGPATVFRDDNSGEAGAVDIAYSAAPFKFTDPDREGLLVRGTMPKCAFANVVLWNVFLQTLSYERGHVVSLNRAQMKSIDPETRRYAVLISKTRPVKLPVGVDWMFSEGRTTGTVFWRFLLPEGKVETPVGEVVQLSTYESL